MTARWPLALVGLAVAISLVWIATSQEHPDVASAAPQTVEIVRYEYLVPEPIVVPPMVGVIEKVREVERIVEVPVEIIKEVEVVREVPRPLREFESLEVMEQWLDTNMLALRLLADGTGRPLPSYDCDDYATELQQKALDDGYLLSVQLVQNRILFGVIVTDASEGHMGNLAIIGNYLYYVESVPPHKVRYVTRRD